MRRITLSLSCLLALCLAAPAWADTLELKDGKIVEGVVIKDGDNYVVMSRFGPKEIPIADVKTWQKGTSIDKQVKDHLAKLDDEDTANRLLLAKWLKDIGRAEEADELAHAILEIDPENAKAHAMLGHIRHKGEWCTPDEAKRRQGLERHGDRWYTAQEWKNLAEAERAKAAAAEEAAAKKAVNEAVNKAVRLMLSPDPAVSARGKGQLERLAEKHDSDYLRELVGKVGQYLEMVNDLRKKAATLGGAGTAGTGTVMGEIRATMSKLKRPIQVFETSLASNIGGAPVRIQLPEIELVKVRTTGIIPVTVR